MHGVQLEAVNLTVASLCLALLGGVGAWFGASLARGARRGWGKGWGPRRKYLVAMTSLEVLLELVNLASYLAVNIYSYQVANYQTNKAEHSVWAGKKSLLALIAQDCIAWDPFGKASLPASHGCLLAPAACLLFWAPRRAPAACRQIGAAAQTECGWFDTAVDLLNLVAFTAWNIREQGTPSGCPVFWASSAHMVQAARLPARHQGWLPADSWSVRSVQRLRCKPIPPAPSASRSCSVLPAHQPRPHPAPRRLLAAPGPTPAPLADSSAGPLLLPSRRRQRHQGRPAHKATEQCLGAAARPLCHRLQPNHTRRSRQAGGSSAAPARICPAACAASLPLSRLALP